MTTEAPAAQARPEVVLDDVEQALQELLRCYASALRFAHDMPWLGSSRVTFVAVDGRETGRLWRLGSRFFTRVYVETHVRKHVRTIKDRLGLRRLGVAEDADRQRIAALVQELEQNVEPLFRRPWLVGLLARAPAIIGLAVPILTGFSIWPLEVDVSLGRAVLIFAVIVLAFWVLVVWPSVRLGFRVKRAILGGGVDLARPLLGESAKVRWAGFAAPRIAREEGGTAMEFPSDNAYKAENAAYSALRTRKPVEVPLDLLLGLGIYLWVGFWASIGWAFVATAVEDGLWQTLEGSGFEIGVSLAGVLSCAVLVYYALGSYRKRDH